MIKTPRVLAALALLLVFSLAGAHAAAQDGLLAWDETAELPDVTGGEGIAAAFDADKLNLANFNLDVTSAQITIWVIIIGAIGQNISSYSAGQAVVRRSRARGSAVR